MEIYVSGIKRLGPEDNDAATVRIRLSHENQDLISADLMWYVKNKDVNKHSTIEELEEAALKRTKAFLIEAVAVIG